MVTTFAGTGSTGFLNTASGTTSSFNRPNGLAIDAEDTIYVADTFNHSIRKISPQGVVTTLAGSGTAGIQNSNTGTSSTFRFPMGVAVDYAGVVYVADTDNNLIRKITPTGSVTTLAGSIGLGSQDGLGSMASFNGPCGVAVDSFGNVYVADTGNHVIRKITPTGAVTTVAGLGGAPGFQDGTGRCARFNAPVSLTIDSNGALYVCERFNHAIRKILLRPAASGAASGSGSGSISCSTTNSDTAIVTTIAGNGSTGAANGIGTSSRFNTPNALCFDPTGKLYVADTLNNTIRMVTILPLVTPVQPRSCITLCKPCCAGTTSTPGSAICTPSAAF
jgi:sugar lactone lactonase YvrE